MFLIMEETPLDASIRASRIFVENEEKLLELEEDMLNSELFRRNLDTNEIEPILPKKYPEKLSEKEEITFHIYFKLNFSHYGFEKAVDLDEKAEKENKRYDKRVDFRVTRKGKKLLLELEFFPERFIEHGHNLDETDILFIIEEKRPIPKESAWLLPKEIIYLDRTHFNKWFQEESTGITERLNKPYYQQKNKLDSLLVRQKNIQRSMKNAENEIRQYSERPISRITDYFSLVYSLNCPIFGDNTPCKPMEEKMVPTLSCINCFRNPHKEIFKKLATRYYFMCKGLPNGEEAVYFFLENFYKCPFSENEKKEIWKFLLQNRP